MLCSAAMEEGKREVRIILPPRYSLSFFNIISRATFRYPYTLIIFVSLINLLISSLAKLHFVQAKRFKFYEHIFRLVQF